MALKIFGKDEEAGEDEFIEIESLGEVEGKTHIRIENLSDYRDVEKIQKLVREGNIVFLKIRKIKERDLGELKRCVERLRKTAIASNGDIIGVDEDFLIITPTFAKIYRGESTQKPTEEQPRF